MARESAVVYIEVVLAKIAARVQRDGMFAGHKRIGVAISGGADSVALLHVLPCIVPGRMVVAVHLNHRLRGRESDSDEEFVRRLALDLGVEFFVRRQQVTKATGPGGSNVEEAGRRCRYRFFRELIREGACDVVATAHTRSDQAETVLFRLLRGSAGNGLSGIWPNHRPGIVRPMLDVSRSEVLCYLRGAGIPWRDDSSNADSRYARNRIRHSLLPHLEREWNPKIERVLANTAEWAREEERYWKHRIRDLQRTALTEDGPSLLLEVSKVRGLQIAEQRRLVHSILRRKRIGARNVGFSHVEAVLGLLASQTGPAAVDLPGVRAERSCGVVRFVPATYGSHHRYDLPLPVPGSVRVPGLTDSSIRARVLAAPKAETLYNAGDSVLLDWDRIPRLLRLRSWQAGDRYRPAGHDAPRKIRDLFRSSRITAWNRVGWPVVTASENAGGPERIVWARRFGPEHEVIATASSCNVLVLDDLQDPGGGRVPESNREAS